MNGGRINPVTLSFESKQMEIQYWAAHLPKMRKQVVFALSTALVLYAAFGFLDLWVVPALTYQPWIISLYLRVPAIIPDVVYFVWAIRAFVSLMCVALIPLTSTKVFERWHQLLVACLPTLGGLGILLMIVVSSEIGRQLYYVGLILAIIWTMLSASLRIVYGIPICLALIFGYEFIVIFYEPIPLPFILNNTFFLIGTMVIASVAGYTIERYSRITFCQRVLIEHEHRKAEDLLLNILPPEIALILKSQPGIIAQRYEQASVLFADIVDFTPLSENMSSEEMVRLLNELFSYFDSLVEKYDLEKIRTIGDNYMVTSGVPRPRDDHAQALAGMALDMRDFATASPTLTKGQLQLRIGISSGPVVAGVIGRKKFQYDVWGSAVNTASHMERQGVPGGIQITAATYELLKDEFICEARGPIAVKGIGAMDTWFLVDSKQTGNPRSIQSKSIGILPNA